MPKILIVILVLLFSVSIAANENNPSYLQGKKYFYSGDFQSAKKIFESLANNGSPDGQVSLGMMYMQGLGAKQNYNKAKQLFESAPNNPAALSALAYMYSQGMGVEKNKSKALAIYNIAAKLGHHGAMNNIGIMYQNGDGVKQNDQVACDWFEKSSSHGDVDGKINLAYCYAKGKGREKDSEKGFAIIKQTAEKSNHPKAQYFLGALYVRGIGVKQDIPQALAWLSKSASQGNVVAMNEAGKIYLKYAADDQAYYKKGISWLAKGAKYGNPESMYYLGLSYLEGIGVQKNKSIAHKWVYLSSVNGLENAKALASKIYTELSESQKKQTLNMIRGYNKAYPEFRSDFYKNKI